MLVKPPAFRLRPALTSSSTKRSSGNVIVPGLPMWPLTVSQLPSGTYVTTGATSVFPSPRATLSAV